MLLTVGMPVYNASSTVVASIRSVLDQSWTGEMEILIVDDGSTDDTLSILKQQKALDNRIRIISHEKNLGRPFARNTVLENAFGTYLTWIDADDTWHPEKLKFQFDSLCKYSLPNDRAIALCPFTVKWGQNMRGRNNVPTVGLDDIATILDARNPAYLWTMLTKLCFYRSVGGFDEKLPRLQDTDIVIRLLLHGCFFVSTDQKKPLCVYNKSDIGKSGKVVFEAMQRIFLKHNFLYRRFGREFFHGCRAMHHQLGFRHSRSNGEINRAAFHYMCYLMHSAIRQSIGRLALAQSKIIQILR